MTSDRLGRADHALVTGAGNDDDLGRAGDAVGEALGREGASTIALAPEDECRLGDEVDALAEAPVAERHDNWAAASSARRLSIFQSRGSLPDGGWTAAANRSGEEDSSAGWAVSTS